MTVNGQKPFANMKIGDYDRIYRVLQQYGSTDKDLMTATIKIANDLNFVGKVNIVQDIASITEAINTKMLSLKRPEQSTYLNVAFRTIFNKKINAANALDPAIRSQWTSSLSMALPDDDGCGSRVP
ncbi:unnamed protein product [Adineta steineri]|uniref:Uncharacterized protein n=1 Tax=Adineta steineri TaxID=433720 RepID=A0A814RDR5_9BILA|nr:unnamed protein product [Adineta steineri]CAF3547260.1 unnamed protein product [Adineta steineri]